jgi:hypothetical protein
MTPASIELDELQLVPYRAPPMLELTCATVRDVSYWCVAELTSRSEASFIRATGSRERCDVVKHARRNQIGDSSFSEATLLARAVLYPNIAAMASPSLLLMVG